VTGALDGLRVIELCQVMAGPFCGQVLGDMGADVIKEPRVDRAQRLEVGAQARRDAASPAGTR
jgi:crotonobetainyl-CoA:carnitine CoA-transferase CaiB-like acyl-CoA transferase